MNGAETAAPAKHAPWVLPVVIAAALAAPFCFDAVSETDAGWHLALGRLILKSGIPYRNALTWTAADFPWYPTSWLYDVLCAGLLDRAGMVAFQAVGLVFAFLTLLFAAGAARRIDRAGAWLALPLALLLVPRLTERPHVATWPVIAAVLALSLVGRERGLRFRLLCLPLIALGSNLHSGALFASIVLGAFCLEAFLKQRDPRELAVAFGGFVALLCNPGGAFNLRYTVMHLHVQEVVALQEFLRPSLVDDAAFYVLAPMALVLALRDRARGLALPALALCFAGLGFFAARMTFEFFIIALPCLALAFAPLRERFGGRAVPVALTLVTLLAASGARLGDALNGFELAAAFDRTQLPVGAAEYAKANGLDGRVFTAFRDGGYLEYALPEVPAFQDGRVQAFPPEFFAREQAAEHDPAAWDRYLHELNVEWVVATRVPQRLGSYDLLHHRPGWALVYWDAASEIWLRRDVHRFEPLISQDELHHFVPWGRIVGAVAQAKRADLPQYLAEVDRIREAMGDDPLPHIAACAVARRLDTRDAVERCTKATDLAKTDAQLQLLRAVADLKPGS